MNGRLLLNVVNNTLTFQVVMLSYSIPLLC
jgi:hypothetical protein